MQKKKPSKNLSKIENKQLIDHLQRLQAEFENYRKRTEAEKTQLMDLAKKSILLEFLPVLDNLDRAASHLPSKIKNDPWAIGIQNVGKQLVDILGKMGVKKFSSLNQKFDYHRHEAVEYIDSDQPEGTVIEEIAPGYEINGQIIRPAMVKVSKKTKLKS